MSVMPMQNLFSGLITSKTRTKLLIRLFFNPQAHAYLRQLAKEFNVSTNAVREELNQLKKADLLKTRKQGRQIHYMANTEHPLFPELKSMAAKAVGFDQIIESIVNRLGKLERAYIIDDYAEGKQSSIVDLLLVGNIDPYHLDDLSRKTERYIKKKIRSLVVRRDEFKHIQTAINNKPHLIIWEKPE
jgi:DNA-binding transcriptional regulator YhcF (GntR family)